MTYGAFNPALPGVNSPVGAACKGKPMKKGCAKCGKSPCACKGKKK